MANDILLFADDTGANVLTQVEYAADTQRTLGNQAGIARSAFVNKVLRQTSFMSVALAQLIVDRTTQSVLDDGDDVVLLANMKNATDVAFNTNAATAKTTPVDADLFPIVDSAASNVLKKLSWLNLKATLKTYFDTLYSVVGSGNISGVRQTVQSSSVGTSGFSNFISIGTGLAVNIAATTTPIVIHAAGGAISADRVGTISSDTSITGLTANTTNYLFADIAAGGAVTLGANTVAHLEQFGGTPAITNNLLTFNIGNMMGYLGNGATAPQVWRVPIGEAVTNATNVTSVVNYALNGLYDSGWTATLPTTAVIISKNSNLGVAAKMAMYVIENTTADIGYSIGDTVIKSTGEAVSAINSPAIIVTKNTIRLANIGPIYLTNGTTPLNPVVTTSTSWKYKLIAQRGW